MADETKPVPESKKDKKDEQVKLSGTWELVKNAWEVFKKDWKTYVLYQLIAFAGLILPMIGLMVVFFKDNLSEIRSYVDAGIDVNPEKVIEMMKNFITNPLTLILMVVIFAISIIINLGYAKYIYQKFVGKNDLTIKESLSYALNNFLPYFGVSLLVGLIVFGGMLLLIIPGLMFAVWYLLYTVVFIAEDLRGTSVLKRSKELVKGYFWPVTGRFLLFFVGASIIDNILTRISEQDGAISFLVMPVQLAFSFIISVVGIVFIYQIYSELKQIKK